MKNLDNYIKNLKNIKIPWKNKFNNRKVNHKKNSNNMKLRKEFKKFMNGSIILKVEINHNNMSNSSNNYHKNKINFHSNYTIAYYSNSKMSFNNNN